jgi:hypothetical protein
MYHRPKDVFLDSSYASEFHDSKAYLNARGESHDALIKLGCKTSPIEEDYVDLLRWIASHLPELSNKRFKEKYVPLIHYAYSKISTLDFIGYGENIILTHDGNMVRQKDVAEHRVFLDDDLQLSERIKAKKIPIWFVDCGQKGYDFIEVLNVPKLSESVTLSEKLIKGTYPANDFAENFLSKLKSSEVTGAMQSIIQQNSEFRKDLKEEMWLDSIKELQAARFCEIITIVFRIGMYEFAVETGCCFDNGIVYFSKDLGKSEMRDALAMEVAKTALRTKYLQSSLADAVDRFLDGNIVHYLSTRGYVLQKSLEKPKFTKKTTITQLKPSEKTVITRSEESKLTSETTELPIQETGSNVGEYSVHIETDQQENETISLQTGTEELEAKIPESGVIGLDSEGGEFEEEKEIEVEVISREVVEAPPSTGWKGTGPKPAERFRMADISYDWIIRMEKSEDLEYVLDNVSDKDTGYDVKVSKAGNIIKMIEVKSTSASCFPRKISMTPNEWRTAKKEGTLYWLYVVCDVGKENKNIEPEIIKNKVKKFQNPYELFKGNAIFEKRKVTHSEKRVIINLSV